MRINESWHGEAVDTKLYNWNTKNNPIQIKPINEDTVIYSKMNAEELEIYLKDIKHKSINRVKGEQQ
nr:MAG: hypothetical protein [Bacteriophage sp.]